LVKVLSITQYRVIKVIKDEIFCNSNLGRIMSFCDTEKIYELSDSELKVLQI
jgi:hypothetical protein